MTKSLWRDLVYKTIDVKERTLFDEIFERIYQEFEKPTAWRVFPEVRSLLKRLKKKYILGVASNWDERLPFLLHKLRLNLYFKYQFISFYMGVAKPDPRFFNRALGRLKLPAQNVCHVGDDLENDYQGAKKAALISFLIKRGFRSKKRDVFRGLRDVENILPKIYKRSE